MIRTMKKNDRKFAATWRCGLAIRIFVSLFVVLAVHGQDTTAAAAPAAVKDSLNRSTPTGRVPGFLAAARPGNAADEHDSSNADPTNAYVPAWLAKRGWLSIPLWQWLALAAGLSLAVR